MKTLAIILSFLSIILFEVTGRPSVFSAPNFELPSPNHGSNGISDTPLITVSNSSKEGIDIANRINHLFNDQENNNYGSPNPITATNLNKVESPSDSEAPSGSSKVQLNLNLDLELDHGKPTRLSLPQGELTVMYLPKKGQASSPEPISLPQEQLEKFLDSTSSQTNLVRMPNGGVLFTAFTPNDELKQESEKNVTRKVSENPTGRLEEKKLKSKRPGLDKGNFLDTKKIYSHLRQNPEVIQKWNQGAVPQFPNFHGLQTEQLDMSRDPNSDAWDIRKIENDHAQNYRQVGALGNTLEDMKLHTKGSNEDHTLTELNQGNNVNHVNIVSPGKPHPIEHKASAIVCRQDDSTGGKKICKERTPTPCNGNGPSAFGDRNGNNCGGGSGSLTEKEKKTKQSDDNPVEEFMGHIGGGGSLVPFSQQISQMNMFDGKQRTTTSRPVSRRTTNFPSTSTIPASTTVAALANRDLNEMIVERVMGMDHASLADALMDPMMMMMGTMIALAGAYMAIVMQELNAANAAVLSQLG